MTMTTMTTIYQKKKKNKNKKKEKWVNMRIECYNFLYIHMFVINLIFKSIALVNFFTTPLFFLFSFPLSPSSPLTITLFALKITIFLSQSRLVFHKLVEWMFLYFSLFFFLLYIYFLNNSRASSLLDPFKEFILFTFFLVSSFISFFTLLFHFFCHHKEPSFLFLLHVFLHYVN